jgi:pimeloyl-ACP methyl ester carboxylesterase
MYLFIHGTGATSSFWLPQIRGILNLDETYSDGSILETFTLSLPGHPNDDRKFSLEDINKKIQEDFATKLALQQKMANKLILSGKPEIVAGLRNDKIILVAHSVGGVVALNFAMKNPNMVEKMVLVSTPNQFNLSLINFLDWFYKNLVFPRSEKFLKKLQKLVGSIRWKTALQIFIENPKRKGFDSCMKIVKSHNFEKEFRKLTLEDQLKLIKIPILAISGQRDFLASVSQVKKLGEVIQNYAGVAKSKKTIIDLNNTIPSSTFQYKMYKGVGHNTMDEDLVSFIYDFREFLKN